MTDLATITTARPEPARDRWGRYLVADPTGKRTAHTRATTWAKTLADTFALTQWAKRVVAVGMARRPDLVALAANKTCADKDALKEVIEAAEEAGGANEKRRIGSGLHEMLELLDGGQPAHVPEHLAAHITAYQAALERAGVEVLPEFIESVCVVDALKVAGTFDRIVRVDGVNYIADLKTGTDPLTFGAGEIAIQLALYAHADVLWDTATQARVPMPEVDRTKGLVIHLPASGAARCELHWVDIAAGWEAAQWCGLVRAWRSRKDLSHQFVAQQVDRPKTQAVPVSEASVPPPPAQADTLTDDLRARIQWVCEAHPEMVAVLTNSWPSGVPTFGQLRVSGGEHTGQQLTQIQALVEAVEAKVEAPFSPPPKDALPKIRDTTTAVEDWPSLLEAHRAIDGERQRVFARWAMDARDAGRAWDMRSGDPTTRKEQVGLAAVALTGLIDSETGDESLVRHVLAAVLGPVHDGWRTGAVIGCLALKQAQRARALATDLDRGDRYLKFDADGLPQLAEREPTTTQNTQEGIVQ